MCMLHVRYCVHFSNASIKLNYFCLTVNRIPFTDSESEPPTPPPVSDCPHTTPDYNISIAMPNPSQLSSTSSLIGGQPSISMVVPIAVTSTEIIANVQSTISISVENSVRDQISITPTSSAALMVSTTNNTLRILTSTWDPNLMTTSPMFITQNPTVVLLVPLSTTRTTVSTSTEQSSLGQSVTGTHGQ